MAVYQLNVQPQNGDPFPSGDAARIAQELYSTIRDGVGTTSNYIFGGTAGCRLLSNAGATSFSRSDRLIYLFDTSFIGSDWIINSCVLSVYVSVKSTGNGDTTLRVVTATPSSLTTRQASDYQNMTTTAHGTSALISTFVVDTRTDISLNANAIVKGGTTALGIRLGWDFSGGGTPSLNASAITGIQSFSAGGSYLTIDANPSTTELSGIGRRGMF